jgi:hypothetical protein
MMRNSSRHRLIFSDFPSQYPFSEEYFQIELLFKNEIGQVVLHEEGSSLEFYLEMRAMKRNQQIDEEDHDHDDDYSDDLFIIKDTSLSDQLLLKENKNNSSSSCTSISTDEHHQPHEQNKETSRRSFHLSNGRCCLDIKILYPSYEQMVLVAIPCCLLTSTSTTLTSSPPLLCPSNQFTHLTTSTIAISKPFQCVRHRLVVPNPSDVPTLWYKDLSYSKHHCLHIHVQLMSPVGVVVDRIVPLVIQLKYYSPPPPSSSSSSFSSSIMMKKKKMLMETGQEDDLPDQMVLKVNDRSTLRINEEGSCVIKCNFTQVSSRHHSRCFSLLISPDYEQFPECSDISPVEVGKVEVRSRPMKESRAKNVTKQTVSNSPRPHNTRAVKRMSEFTDSQTIDLLSAVVTSGTEPSSPLPTPAKVSVPDFVQKKRKCEPSPKFPTPGLENSFFSDLFDAPLPHHPPGATEWIQSVATKISALKWKEIGQESVPCHSTTGSHSVVLQRPVYEMPFPNIVIDQIIESSLKFFPDSLPPSDTRQTSSINSPSSLPPDEFLTSPEGRSNSSTSGTDSNRKTLREHGITQSLSYRQTSAKYQDPFLRADPPSPLFSQPRTPTTPSTESFPLPMPSLLSISEE